MPHTSALNSKAPYFTSGKAGSVKNNGATIFYGGSIASSVYSSLGLAYLGYRSGVSEFVPYAGSTPMNVGVVAGLSNGTWQKLAAGKYILLTYTSQIAGIANTLLNFPSSYNQKGGQNFYTPKFYTQRYVLGGGWDYTTGMPNIRLLPGYPMPTTIDASNAEAYPGTRAIPGRLFFIATSIAKDAVPSVANYKAKTD